MTRQTARETADQVSLHAIAAATGRERDLLVDAFLRPRVGTRGSFESMASELCRTNGIREAGGIERHHADVLGILYEEAVKILNAVTADPARIAKITSFDGFLFYQSKAPTRSHFDGAAGGIRPGGATALQRRRRELFKTRSQMTAALGYEPTEEAIVEETNARMNRLRKDAARQSMIATVADFQSVDSVALLPEEHDRSGADSDSPLMEHEGRRLVGRVAEVAESVEPGLGRIAEAWLGGVYDQGAPRELAEVARLCAVSIATAAQSISRVQEIASTSSLVTEFGLETLA